MKSLSNLLEKRKKVIKTSLDDKDIFYVFRKIIKEEFGNYGAEKLKADFFKNKTIFVKCESSAFASELFLNQKRIIRKINEELGEGAVERIRTK